MSANVGTYDNVLPTGLANIVVQNIQGTPTGYNVYDGNGVLVASGSWPSVVAPSFVGGSDNSVSATGTTSISLTPQSGAATPQIGTVLVVTVSPDNAGHANAITCSGGHVTNWLVAESSSGQNNPAMFVGSVSTAGAASITITGNTGQELTGTVTAWANVTDFGTIDQTGSQATGEGSASVAPGPVITTTGNGEVILAAISGTASVGVPYGPFTEFSTVSGYKHGSNGNYSAGYYNQTSAGSVGSWGWHISGGFAYTHVSAVSLSPAQGGTTLSIPAPSGTWAPGYYYIDFTGPLGSQGNSVDSVQVQVWRDLGNLPSPAALPPVGTNPTAGTPNAESEDLYLHGWLAHGPSRYSITNTASPNTDNGAVGGLGRTITGIGTGIAAEKSTTLYLASVDPARPRPSIVNFPADYTTTVGGGVASATYEAGVASVVSALGPGTTTGVVYFEGLNEPDETGLSDAQTATLYNQFRTGVRNGSASARAVGPAYVQAGPVGNQIAGFTVANVATWLADVASGGGSVDAISVHNYNGWTADPLVPEAWLTALRTTMSSASIGTAPIFCTELGNIIKNFWNGTTFAYITDRRLVAATAASYLAAERNGIPKEQLLYFYDRYQGGQQVYTCLKSTDGTLGPQATFFRVYSEELWGKSWSRSLDFGTTGNLLYRGEVFSEGSSGSGTGAVAVIYAPGMTGESITLSGVGSSAVTVSDWLGNTSSYSPSGGQITVPINDLPTYVRLPLANAGTVAVAGSGLGTNLALTATATAGSNPASLTTTSSLNNGVLQTGGYIGGGSDDYYQSTTLPQYVQLTWGSAKSVNHVVFRQAAPYMDWPSNSSPASAMLTGKLEYWNGSSWVACPTNGQNHWDTSGNYSNSTASEFFTTIGHDNTSQTDAMVFSQWDQNWVPHAQFSAPVTTTKIRLTISTVSAANFVSNATNPIPTPALSASEIMAFLTSSTIATQAKPGIVEVIPGSAVVGITIPYDSSLTYDSPWGYDYPELGGNVTAGPGYVEVIPGHASVTVPAGTTTRPSIVEVIPGTASVGMAVHVTASGTITEVIPGVASTTVPAGLTAVHGTVEVIPGHASVGMTVGIAAPPTIIEIVPGSASVTVPAGVTAVGGRLEVIPGHVSVAAPAAVQARPTWIEVIPGTATAVGRQSASVHAVPGLVEVIPGVVKTNTGSLVGYVTVSDSGVWQVTLMDSSGFVIIDDDETTQESSPYDSSALYDSGIYDPSTTDGEVTVSDTSPEVAASDASGYVTVSDYQ